MKVDYKIILQNTDSLLAEAALCRYPAGIFAKRKELLPPDTIGTIWDSLDYCWDKNCVVATEYYKKNGNLPGSAAAGLPAGDCVGEMEK